MQRLYSMTPVTVMWLALLMYAVKVCGKLVFGYSADLAAVYGDGWHNVSDIIEAYAVIMVLRFAGGTKSQYYPNGKGNFESMMVFLQGVLLAYVGGVVGYESFVGFMAGDNTQALGADMPLMLSFGLITLYAMSAGLSFVVSHIEQTVGKRHNRPLVVADGQETKSDGFVELGVLAGIVGMIVFNSALIGHATGLFVCFVLWRTSAELLQDGFHALTQRTTGVEHDTAIKAMFLDTSGVYDVLECRTWRVGGIVQVLVKVVVGTGVSSNTERDLKWAVGQKITAYLEEHDMPESELHIRFDPGEANHERHAFGIVYQNGEAIMTDFASVTHLRVCDYERGRITRIKDESVTSDTVLQVLGEKCVDWLHCWDDSVVDMDARLAGAGLSCRYRAAITPLAPSSTK